MPKNTVFVHHHLGLGDHLVCNGLLRTLSEREPDTVFLIATKHHNMTSVKDMFGDNDNLIPYPVSSDGDAVDRSNQFPESLKLGMWAKDPGFNIEKWDQEMYRQADVPFENRWSKFKCPVYEKINYSGPYCAIHDDKERGFVIGSKCKFDGPKVKIMPGIYSTIFHWTPEIVQADELHLIDSCFAILADSIPLKAKRKVIHLSARPGGRPPQYKQDWEFA